jgi:DNA-binding CsgD family transcriptional regulator
MGGIGDLTLTPNKIGVEDQCPNRASSGCGYMFDQEGNGPGLGRLNESERRVLYLLAEGHTAKTIAREIGLTPAAVNERLREARRKTGVGSSRELARLLKSQENRHDEKGVASTTQASAGPVPTNAKSARLKTGVGAMLFISLVAAAGAATILGQQAPTGKVDPLLGSALPSGPDPAALHAQVRTESRDPYWAPRTEEAIRARALQIPVIGKGGNTLRVTCASKICEIAGSIRMPGNMTEEYDPKLPESRAQSALQTPPFVDDISKLGLKNEAGLFTGAKGDKNQAIFLLYYSPAK